MLVFQVNAKSYISLGRKTWAKRAWQQAVRKLLLPSVDDVVVAGYGDDDDDDDDDDNDCYNFVIIVMMMTMMTMRMTMTMTMMVMMMMMMMMMMVMMMMMMIRKDGRGSSGFMILHGIPHRDRSMIYGVMEGYHSKEV